MAMQGSSIAGVDVGGADIKLNEDGSYTLALGCTDMGTGCDTIMAQIAADCLETPMENIVVFSVDTDISPYDSGSYASSTTYTTGVAVMKACKELRGKICEVGAQMLGTDVDKVAFDGSYVFVDEDEEEEKKVSLEQVALKGTFFNNIELQVVKQHSSPLSPPPFMVGMAEVEVDTETGTWQLLTVVPQSIQIWHVYRQKVVLRRESVWPFLKTYSIPIKEKSEITPLCSIRFQPEWISERSGWILKAVMKRVDRLEPNLSENL